MGVRRLRALVSGLPWDAAVRRALGQPTDPGMSIMLAVGSLLTAYRARPRQTSPTGHDPRLGTVLRFDDLARIAAARENM